MICASIQARTNSDAVDALQKASRSGADLAEVRFDLIRDASPEFILKNKPLPVIATCRPTWEGGAFAAEEFKRVGLLEDACLHGADWVDVEYKGYKAFPRRQAKLILSYHDFDGTPDLEKTVHRMNLMEPDLVKVATKADGVADLLTLLRFQKQSPGLAAFIAMGAYGEAFRILYHRYGGFLTYAPLEAGKETAPGQVTVAELVKEYRLKNHDDDTKIFGVVGNPVAHSKSPKLFNRIFRELGLKACYVRLPLDDPSIFRDLMETMEIDGASVTVPHKQAVLAALDEIDPMAKDIGAVNTVTRKDGKLYGANTDAPGAMDAMRDGAMKKWDHGVYGMRALVLGAGGAARALAFGLKVEGASVTIANRTWEKARALADELGCDAIPLDEVLRARPQVIVNATTVGMESDEMPPVDEVLVKDTLVMDSVYTPRMTTLLKTAKERGAQIVDGVEFFLRQADLQLKTWFGRGIPTELMKLFRASL